MFPCMPMFTPQGPILPPISPSTSPSPSPTGSASDAAEMNVLDCSSGYSSLDESWATLSPYLQQHRLGQLYSTPYLPYWYHQWFPQVRGHSTSSEDMKQSLECKKSHGFPPEYNLTPLRPYTPVCAGIDNVENPAMVKIFPKCSTATAKVIIPSQQHLTRLKSQRSLILLDVIVDLLSNVNDTDVIEWTSTKFPEFKIRDRKKFMSHWNTLSGKQESFMAIACKLRGIGNEKMKISDGQKIRLITRTAPYIYRFLPDYETFSFPMLHDHGLQRLVTKMLLSFHLHQRKHKKYAESSAFPPS